EIAGVGVLGDEAKRLPLARAADQNRDVAADRLWVVQRSLEPVVLALEAGFLVREHGAGDLDRLLEPLEALLEWREVDPVGPVLLLVPGGADAEDRAPARGDVERRGDLREQRGVPVGDAADEKSEVDG